MNEKRKAKIIEHCFEAVASGKSSREECLQRYPQLRDELQSLFQLTESISNAGETGMDAAQVRMGKVKLLNKLPTRTEVVTKTGQSRYKLQTTKRRFAMTWVLIVTTLLSVLTGTGVVFASGEALPGDALYGVKEWRENVQLAFASDETDAELFLQFTEERVREMEALMAQGRFDDLEDAAEGYENQMQAMMRNMAEIQAENPDEAVRLRTETEQKLQDQARQMETLLDEPVDETTDDTQTGDQTRDQLRVMLETNTQTRLRINEVVEEPDDGDDGTGDDGDLSAESMEAAGDETTVETNGNATQARHSEFVNASGDEQNATFQFRISSAEQIGVYAELNGAQYACYASGDDVTCNIPNTVEKGTLNLYCLEDNSLLYSHAYDYDWLGMKDAGEDGSQTQSQGSSGGESSGNGGSGGKGGK